MRQVRACLELWSASACLTCTSVVSLSRDDVFTRGIFAVRCWTLLVCEKHSDPRAPGRAIAKSAQPAVYEMQGLGCSGARRKREGLCGGLIGTNSSSKGWRFPTERKPFERKKHPYSTLFGHTTVCLHAEISIQKR